MKLILSIMLLSATWSHAETLGQLRNRVDTWLTNRVTVLVQRQNTYFAARGKYFQGLITHSSIPDHSSSTAADRIGDRLTIKPTDQAASWANVFPEFNTESFAAAAKVDVYDGPLGRGYWIIVYVRYQGVTYSRCKSFGPDKSRDHPWEILDEPNE